MTARNVAGASTLVVYYSAHGHTRRVAKTIIRALGADAFALAPATASSEPDLNYNDPAAGSRRSTSIAVGATSSS